MGLALDSLGTAALAAWTPVRVRAKTREIDWALLDEPFVEPFFEQTADRAMQHPFNLAFARRTPLAVLDRCADVPGIAPTGFVFHMSRCGSTLIAQMLVRLSQTIVLSEPQPIDALLRLRGRGIDDDTLIAWLRAMIGALARPRRGEQRLFVKFYAWHVLELPFIARAYPDVPWIFVFREPRAVLGSQARNPGAEVVNGTIDPSYLGIDHAAVYEIAPAEYAARVLAALCEAALQHAVPGRSAFVDYATLPESVLSELLGFFGVGANDADIGRMRTVTQREAKDAETTPFLGRARERDASGDIDRLAARWLDAPFAALRARAGAPR